MAYRDDVLALNPDHFWRFDENLNDSGVATAVNGTGTGISAATAICEDATNSRRSSATSDRIALTTAATIDQALARKAVGGWIELDRVQPPPKSLYREGTTNNQWCFVCWAGNNLMLDVVISGTGQIVQLFANQPLSSGRAYHILARFSGTAFEDRISLYVDGVLQQDSAPGIASIPSRAVGEWADPSNTTEVGNRTVLLNGAFNADHNFWAAWADSNAGALSDSDIRVELFEKGALPGVTITSDSEGGMQTQLNALASTLRPDEPLNIRVDSCTSANPFNLTADNITHDPLASIHVQYTGVQTLNWTNTNGSNASIGSSIGGGTLNLLNPATLTVAPLITSSEVRVYDAGTTTEVAGIESSGELFAASISVNSVDVVVHKEDYEYVRVEGVDTSAGDVTVPINQVFDRNYSNP